MENDDTHYGLLEVSESATSEEIKKAFHRLSLEYHPDTIPADLRERKIGKNAAEMFIKIKEAYDTLINPEKRNIYDAALKKSRIAKESQTYGSASADYSCMPPPPPQQYTSSSYGQQTSSQSSNSAVEDFFGTIADYFSSVFRLVIFGMGIIRRHLFTTFVLSSIIVISYEGLVFYKSLSAKTNLTFGYTIDGKELPTGIAPEIRIDGQPFANGSQIGLGRHELHVSLKDAEPFQENFWVFGAKNLGPLPLETSKGSLLVTVNPIPDTIVLEHNGEVIYQGNAPLKVDKLPVGNYSLAVCRKGWELDENILINRNSVTTIPMEFPYGSIEVTSEPLGLIVSTNGMEIGKTPLMLQELKPGQYTLSASDGENDLMENITVGPKEAARCAFKFRYGSVQLTSIPTGAIVIRKGRVAGTTPLKLGRIPAGETAVVLKLDGYVTTNFALHVDEGETANMTAKLVSERYVQAMNQAQEAFDAGQFAEAQKNLATALEIEPLDKRAKALSGEISFKTRYQMAEDALSHDKFDEALRALNGAEQFAPDSNDITVLRETINKRKAKQFEKLIQDAKNSLKQGALVDAMQQLADAEKLYPHDQRVASLSKKILPLQREIKWKEVTQDFRDSPISETYLWKYSSSLMAVRDGTIKAMGEILSGWKIEGEDRPDKRTIVIKIKPSGLGALGTPCVGVLMLSETENGVVEMRSKFWAYPRQESTAAEHLHTLAWELSKCLTRKLGAPINSGSLPNHR